MPAQKHGQIYVDEVGGTYGHGTCRLEWQCVREGPAPQKKKKKSRAFLKTVRLIHATPKSILLPSNFRSHQHTLCRTKEEHSLAARSSRRGLQRSATHAAATPNHRAPKPPVTQHIWMERKRHIFYRSAMFAAMSSWTM